MMKGELMDMKQEGRKRKKNIMKTVGKKGEGKKGRKRGKKRDKEKKNKSKT